MEFKGKELNKWFTRVRKRLGGPPGYKRQNARTFWNTQGEVEKGIGIAQFNKVYVPDGVAVGFWAWVVYDFDLSDHWRKYYTVAKRDDLFILEKEAKLPEDKYHTRHPSDRWVEIISSTCDELEGVFIEAYETQLKPWLDAFVAPDDVFRHIEKNFGYREVLPLRFDPKNIPDYRNELGRRFLELPSREDAEFVDWLQRKGIVSAEEALEIKTASWQHIDDVKEQMHSIGEKMVNTA